MKQGLYAIYDEAAGAILTPFVAANDAVALRMFAGSLRDPQSSLATQPSDFRLCRLAVIEFESGAVEPEPSRHLVMTGDQVVSQLRNQ